MIKLHDKKKPGLVLSGGGIKAGAYHIGVCLALEQRGFKLGHKAGKSKSDILGINHFVGSSAGSIVATFLASGYSLEELVHAFTMGAGLEGFDSRFADKGVEYDLKPMGYLDIFRFSVREAMTRLFLPSFLTQKVSFKGGLEVFLKTGIKVNGLFTTENIKKYFAESVLKTESFDELANELFIVATYLDYPKKAIFGPQLSHELKKVDSFDYFSGTDISDAVAASTALPPVFSPLGITLPNQSEPTYFFDGEIRDTMSTHIAANIGCDLIIASYSMSPYELNSELGSLNQYGIPIIINQAIYQNIHQKVQSYRHSHDTLVRVIDIVNEFLKEKKIGKKDKDALINRIVDESNINLDAHYMYIHPSTQDHQMFFADHFSLSSTSLEEIVGVGYRSAMEKLRIYEV